jgi:hypothetical protein
MSLLQHGVSWEGPRTCPHLEYLPRVVGSMLVGAALRVPRSSCRMFTSLPCNCLYSRQPLLDLHPLCKVVRIFTFTSIVRARSVDKRGLELGLGDEFKTASADQIHYSLPRNLRVVLWALRLGGSIPVPHNHFPPIASFPFPQLCI